MKEIQMIHPDAGRYLGKIAKILYLLTVCAITITGILNKDNLYDIMKFNLLSVVLVSILIFYAKENRIRFLDNRTNLIVVILSYLFSLACIMVSVKFNLHNLWLLGPMIIAMLIDSNFGLSFHLLFSFMLSVNAERSIDSLLYNFILGVIACILSKYILDLTKIGYALIIFLSSNITLTVIMNNFMTQNTIDSNIMYSVVSNILLFVIAFVISRIYLKLNVKTMDGTNLIKDSNQSVNQNFIIEKDIIEKDILEEEALNKLLDVNHELLIRLNKFSKKLYDRSKYISDISYMAAIKINANPNLTKTGGMYSKVGRTVSKDYIVDGIKLLEEYQFPDKVIDIVKQHNLKYENPKSKEAAIVMITDSIIASMDAMKNMKDTKAIPTNKLIDGIFTLRLSKSNLDESGLSITDLKVLKEFYINEFTK